MKTLMHKILFSKNIKTTSQFLKIYNEKDIDLIFNPEVKLISWIYCHKSNRSLVTIDVNSGKSTLERY